MKTKLLGLLAIGLVAGPMVSSAAIISRNYAFSATNFASPYLNLAGSFSVTFDNCCNISDSFAGTTAGLSAPVLNRTIAFPFGYSYQVSGDRLVFGGFVTGNGVGLVQNFTDDFYVVFGSASTQAPIFIEAAQSSRTNSSNSRTSRGTVAVTVASVPEPATLALLGLGLAGLSLARRKRAA